MNLTSHEASSTEKHLETSRRVNIDKAKFNLNEREKIEEIKSNLENENEDYVQYNPKLN